MERSTWLSAAKWTTASILRLREELREKLGVADVALDERVPPISVEVGKVARLPA